MKFLEMNQKYETNIYGENKNIRLTGLWRFVGSGVGTEYCFKKMEYECLDPDNNLIWIDVKNINESVPI